MFESSLSLMGLSLMSVSFFCVCCLFLLREVTTRVPMVNRSGYSRGALRVARGYKIFAWGTMSAVFLGALVMSFAEVFSRL